MTFKCRWGKEGGLEKQNFGKNGWLKCLRNWYLVLQVNDFQEVRRDWKNQILAKIDDFLGRWIFEDDMPSKKKTEKMYQNRKLRCTSEDFKRT